MLRYNPYMSVRSRIKQSRPSRSPLGTAEVRAHNTSVILGEVWRCAPLSRADLARATGLSRSTVSAIAGELVESGILVESQGPIGRTGRPPISLKVAADRAHVVGIEMGASHVGVVRVNLVGEVLVRRSVELPVEEDPAGTLAAIREHLTAVQSDIPLAGVGLAVPSPLDPAQPGLLSERILPAWRGIRVADELGALLDVPVLLGNDANLGALAEHWWGAGRGVHDFAYVKVATGVGAGLFVGGSIYGGAAGISGEIGHTAIAPETGPLCRCGRTGCLEARIGSGALLRAARLHMGDQAPRTLADLIQLALIGEPRAEQLIDTAGSHLGVALANLVNLLNPGLVVLGGKLTGAGERLLQPLRAALRERALSTSLEATRVVMSDLGDDTVALGAATLVLDSVLKDPSLIPSAAA